MTFRNQDPSPFIPESERGYWHYETWEEAARAMRDYYPMGCAIPTCSAVPESQSHFCRSHADVLDRIAESSR